jgi:hypothetical protein
MSENRRSHGLAEAVENLEDEEIIVPVRPLVSQPTPSAPTAEIEKWLAGYTRPDVSRVNVSIRLADFIYLALHNVVCDARKRDQRITKRAVVELALVKLLRLTPPRDYEFFG